MILRINSNDFNSFAGFKYDSVENRNDELNKYIDLFLTNNDIKYFQVRLANCVTADTIAYIVHKVDMKHFIKTDFNTDGSERTHWLCFYKED